MHGSPLTTKDSTTRKMASRLSALAFGVAVIIMMIAVHPAASVAARPASNPAKPPAQLQTTDEAGRAVRVPQPIRRIVSLAPNLTETVFALGLGDRLVGDTDFCDYPAEASKKTHVGGPINPSLEGIVALHPDVVLATVSINRLATVQALEKLGVAVYVTDPRTVEQVISSTEGLGRLLGASDQAATLDAALQQRLQQLRKSLNGSEPRTVLFITWVDPLISVGRNTFLADALRVAGAHSVITSPQDWPTINLEEVVHLQPDDLIFSSDDPEQTRRQVGELRSRPGWQGLQALQQNRIIILGEAFSRPAPRLLDAIEQLARALHPDRFTSPHAAAAATAPARTLARALSQAQAADSLPNLAFAGGAL